MSSDCGPTVLGCWFHEKYNHRDSSSWKKNGTRFIANEGSYNLTGYFSEDSFSIGQIRVNNQSFIEITSVPYLYMFSKVDGVLGLGFKMSDYVPFFYNMIKNKTAVPKPLFSIYLNRDRQSTKGGNVYLGFVEDKHIHVTNNVSDPIKYLSVDSSSQFWQFKMDKVVVNIASNKPPVVLCQNGCNAIVDTSNNVIIGPPDEVAKIHEVLNAKEMYFGRYMVNCDTVNKLQPIDFILGGQKFTLKSVKYIQKMSISAFTFCISAFTPSTTPSEENFWVLGGAFLSEFYSIYDMAKLQIGFVKAA